MSGLPRPLNTGIRLGHWSHKEYDDTRKLYEEGKVEEAVKAVQNLVGKRNLPHYYLVQLYLLASACLQGSDEANLFLSLAGTHFNCGRRDQRFGRDENAYPVVTELRKSIDAVMALHGGLCAYPMIFISAGEEELYTTYEGRHCIPWLRPQNTDTCIVQMNRKTGTKLTSRLNAAGALGVSDSVPAEHPLYGLAISAGVFPNDKVAFAVNGGRFLTVDGEQLGSYDDKGAVEDMKGIRLK